MRTLRKLLKNRFVLAMISLIAIAVFLGFDAWVEAGMYIDNELARLQRVGEPTESSQLDRALPPSTQNAAPFYEAAVALCTSPLATSVEDSAARTLDAHLDTCRADIAAGGAALRLLAEAFERPSCVYPKLPGEGPSKLLPNFIALRRLAQLASLKASLDVREHRYAEALATTAHMLRLEGTYDRRLGLIEEMIMIVALRWTLEPLEEMQKAGVRADYTVVLRELTAARAGRALRFTRWVSAERVQALIAFRKYTAPELAKEAGRYDNMSWTTLGVCGAYMVAPGTMVRLDQRAYLEAMAAQERALTEARLDVDTAEWSEERLEARRAAVRAAFGMPPPWALLTSCFLPNGSRAFEQADKTLHRMDCLAAACRRLHN